MNEDLKPCPFCGAKYSSEKFEKNTVQLMLGAKYYWVVCLKCEVRTGEYSKKEEAIKAWNRRAKSNMAQIKRAYIVHIDFDGDIKSKYSWGTWLVFTELKEVKSVIAEALNDLMRHQKEKGRDETILIGERYIPISDALKSDALLEEYIDYGGSDMGNWEISIFKTFGEI